MVRHYMAHQSFILNSINSDILEVLIDTDLSYKKQDEMYSYSTTRSDTSSNVPNIDLKDT